MMNGLEAEAVCLDRISILLKKARLELSLHKEHYANYAAFILDVTMYFIENEIAPNTMKRLLKKRYPLKFVYNSFLNCKRKAKFVEEAERLLTSARTTVGCKDSMPVWFYDFNKRFYFYFDCSPLQRENTCYVCFCDNNTDKAIWDDSYTYDEFVDNALLVDRVALFAFMASSDFAELR